MPSAQLPIPRVSADPSSAAARQSDGLQSHSRRSGPAADGGVFASVLARRSGTEADSGTKAKTAPDPAAKLAAKGPSADSSVEQGKAKSKTASKDSKDSKATVQAANVLLAAPQVSIASSQPSGVVGKAKLQQLAKEGRIVPGQSGHSGSLLPESPGGDTKLISKPMDAALGSPAVLLDHGGAAKLIGKRIDTVLGSPAVLLDHGGAAKLIGKRIDTVLGSPAVLLDHGGAAKLIGKPMDAALGSPAVLLDHGGAAKTLTRKLDPQGTDTVKLTASSKDPSATWLKSLFTQNLATLVGRRGGKDQGQAGAGFKQWGSPGLVASPIGLPITPTATPVLPTVTVTNNFSNALANLYAGSAGWNTALGNEVAWLARGDMRQVRLRLYPQRLGSLDVHIQLQQQLVNVAFVVQHPAAAGAVQDALAQLGGMLAQQGLNLGDTQVSYGQSQTSPAWPIAGKSNRDVDESGDIALSGLSRHGLGLFDDFA